MLQYFYSYVLLLSNRRLYNGYTDDLRRRLREYQLGKVKSTQYLRPVQLIFYEAFLNELDARRRERYFKTDKGKKMIRVMLREFLQSSEKNKPLSSNG